MRSSVGDRPSIGVPPLRPSSDIVSASGMRSIQPPIHSPSKSMFSPLCGRADPGELRVDRRAVVALLVVLGDHLPVGRELVGVGRHGDQVLGPVRRDDLVEPGDVVIERAAVAGRVDEDPAVPDDDRDREQPELALVEALELAEASRCVAQGAVQLVAPGVVRADDAAPLLACCRTAAARGRGAGRSWRTHGSRRPRRAPAARHRRRSRPTSGLPTGPKSVAVPTHCHPEKMFACSQAKTSGSRYDARGSIREVPNSAYDRATSSAGSGARVPRS